MPEEAEVHGSIRVVLTETDKGVDITIEDNGPGFPEDARDRLLEPYVTTREKGTGLGLAIVNRIIADHAGSISLQNRLDGMRGARVRIWLPHNSLQVAETLTAASESEVTEQPAPAGIV
jgi:two-component system nitrogen regulation sensor histidine kinase NtrY